VPRPASVLARLDTTQLLLQRVSAQAEVDKQKKAAWQAQTEGKYGDMATAQSARDKAQAELDIVNWELDHATVTTPIDGVIFQGDLRDKINAPLKAGDPLFQIGQTDLRAELDVPEDQIMEVRLGQKGEFATSAHPEKPIKFTVERIVPVAAVSSGKNIFKVRVQIEDGQDTTWLRPGLSGLAMIDVRKEPAGWIWIRPAINWLRMKIWM